VYKEALTLHLDQDGSIVGLQASVPSGGGCSQQSALDALERLPAAPPAAQSVDLRYSQAAPVPVKMMHTGDGERRARGRAAALGEHVHPT
jgi:hypothetical protein